MKKLMLAAVLLLLTSCGGWVTDEEYQHYTSLCMFNGGVMMVSKWLTTTVYCNNGAEYADSFITASPLTIPTTK